MCHLFRLHGSGCFVIFVVRVCIVCLCVGTRSLTPHEVQNAEDPVQYMLDTASPLELADLEKKIQRDLHLVGCSMNFLAVSSVDRCVLHISVFFMSSLSLCIVCALFVV